MIQKPNSRCCSYGKISFAEATKTCKKRVVLKNWSRLKTHIQLNHLSCAREYKSVQDDSFSPLDVNAMQTVPENHAHPDWKVSDSFTLNLYVG